jgi:hypothetical protein
VVTYRRTRKRTDMSFDEERISRRNTDSAIAAVAGTTLYETKPQESSTSYRRSEKAPSWYEWSMNTVAKIFTTDGKPSVQEEVISPGNIYEMYDIEDEPSLPPESYSYGGDKVDIEAPPSLGSRRREL